MTHEEAIAEAAPLTREHPDPATHSWLAREAAPGDWGVARVGLPSRGSTVNTQESKPRPPQAADPRPVFWRDVGGPYAS